ncbi:MAG TPA: hypothetical protein VFQ84_12210, partial [Arenimonas sp.]|nr:hypothetical protein [Arenimonas sp.]
MPAPLRAVALASSLSLLLAACSDPAATPEAAPALDSPASSAASVPAAPTDEAGLRQAVREAMASQRVYAPAGDNAIEYYLALRALRPQDAAIGTALMELLPYAVIASEQAVGREDFVEARRLLGLIERADASAPALSRLRESITAAEANAARRLIAEAEAAKLREVQAAEQAAATERERLLAEQRARETAAVTAPAAAPAPATPRPPAATPV